MTETNKKVLNKKNLILLVFALGGLIALVLYFILSRSSGLSEFVEVERQISSGGISLSGEVSTTQIVEMKPKTSGVIDSIYLQEGEYVEKGQMAIAMFASKEMIEVETAAVRLASAENDLDQLQEPADEIDVKKAENDIVKGENNLAQLTSTYNISYQNYLDLLVNLEKDTSYEYGDAFNNLLNVFPDLPGLLSALEDLIKNNDKDVANYVNLVGWPEYIPQQEDKIKDSYANAEDGYKAALSVYRETSRDNTEAVTLLMNATYDAVHDISQVLEDLDVFWAMLYDRIDTSTSDFTALVTHQATTATHIATITSYSSSISDDLQGLDELYDSIEDANVDLANLTETYGLDKYELELIVEEKQLILEDLRLGTDALDVKRQELEVEQKTNSLRTAQESLNDMFIYAPFAGYIAEINGELGETISSSTNVLTIISDVKLIELTINELDMADVEVGQSAIISFDAISDLEINATIVSIDILGTNEQGVISYGAILALDADDARIRSGMNIEAQIITKDTNSVLLIPRSALKEETDGTYYVDLLVDSNSLVEKTEKRTVLIGKEDSRTVEIVSGLEFGDFVLNN